MSEGLAIEALALRYPGFDAAYDLAVPRGALCALIGPSGGGKTTLLNAIAGFETPVSGALTFDGASLLGLAPHKRPMTILFQEHNLFPNLTAFRNVGIGLDPGLRLTEAQAMQVDAALRRVGLADKAGRLPSELSGGERQRVALARALARDKPLLLMDEPFSGLDPGLRKHMLALTDALRKERGTTVLLSLHTPEDMLEVADMAAFVHGGRIALCGEPRALLDNPSQPALRAYLGMEPLDPLPEGEGRPVGPG
jgi:thiamine transport system ATP-binding protein